MKSVFLVTSGDGSDGDRWDVQSIHSTRKGAEAARQRLEQPHYRQDGSSYAFCYRIEEWALDPESSSKMTGPAAAGA